MAARCGFLQEYFLVRCSIATSLLRFPAAAATLGGSPDKVAIQLNDTHPAMAVPRYADLPDEEPISAGIRRGSVRANAGYTNHTLARKLRRSGRSTCSRL